MSGRRDIVPTVLLLTVFVYGACFAEEPPHEPTEIPFNIDYFTAEQNAVINAGVEADTSPYSILSRPIFFQIVYTGSGADETRNTRKIDRDLDVLIYGLGEARDGRLVDYGWIEHVESGRRVWEMTHDNAVRAGGDPRNRKTVTRMKLSPGTYRLRYVSNASHAYGDWQGDAPERTTFYGVSVFNMTALPLIEARLEQAGVASLATTRQPIPAGPRTTEDDPDRRAAQRPNTRIAEEVP